jgi:hypothetical protein
MPDIHMLKAVRGLRWELLIATASLIAALVFNSIQVRNGTEAQVQAKIAAQLGLLTQLQGVMNQSVYSRVPYQKQFEELRAGKRGTVTPAAYRAVVQEASNMEYFAWLFNKGYITTAGADTLWGTRMVCEWRQAFAPAIADAARDYPNLLRFVQTRGQRLLQLAPC